MTTLAFVLALAIALASWAARRAASPATFFAAGQSAGAWLVGVAGAAAAVSAFTFVGGPGLFAVAGAGSLWIILSAPLTGALQCWAVGEPAVAAARHHGVLTPQELIGVRYGGGARTAAALVTLLGCIASTAVQAKAAAVLGAAFLGVPGWVAAAAVMLATTFYAAAGGMRASLLADAVQGAAMGAVGLVLAGVALAAAGGPAAALATLEHARPELLGSFGTVSPARAFGWYLLFCLGTCAQPHYVQKFFFLRSPGELRRLPAVLTGALAATLAVWVGVGLGGTALVARGAVAIGKPDELAPRVMQHLGPWAVLLAAIAVLAALMSTVASFLNLSAAAATRDLPAVLGRPPLPLSAARATTLAIAATGTFFGLASERTVALLGVAGWGFFTAALLPVFTIGLVWPGASGRGAVAAIATGAAADVALEAVHTHLPAGLEPGLAGAALGTLTLLLVSLPAPARTDPRVRPHALSAPPS